MQYICFYHYLVKSKLKTTKFGPQNIWLTQAFQAQKYKDLLK